MTAPPIATIVVTFNSEATIEQCLASLLASTRSCAIFVVDNASADRTLDVVRAVAPEATVVASEENIGFAAGCNAGMRAARALEPAYFFFVNPDARVDAACLDHLIVEMEARGDAAVASPLITNARTGAVWYAGAELDVDSEHFDHVGWGETDATRYGATTVTGRPTGCVMLVRRSAVEQVGPMDATYFLYWEESEWTLRFRAAGHTVLFVPSAVATHDVSSATGGVSSKIYEYYFLRNRLRLIQDSTGRSRRDLVVSTWWASTRRVGNTFRAWGPRAGLATFRAHVLAYVDFWRGRTGRSDRL